MLELAPNITGANSSDGEAITDNVETVGGAADSAGRVFDLKATFGASGSQQTMTCTAKANSNTLTGCSGGDFKVGSTIFIQSAGYPPTLGPPAAVSPACKAYNGASCAGNVRYCYEIAFIQGQPNGAISAPSPAGCVNQAAQTLPPFSGVNIPAITTIFTLPAATNVTNLLIYRSVNGGAYTFLTIQPPGGPFVDTGHFQSVVFNCNDLLVPCAPQSPGVPNDLYAQITAINNSTVTIAPNTNEPIFWFGFAYGFKTNRYPSIPTISGSVTVRHDDTPAFYKASVALVNESRGGGQMRLHIPAGNYNIHSADPYGRGAAFHLNKIYNLTIEGDGDSSKIFQSNDRSYGTKGFIDAVCGYSANNPADNCSSYAHLGGNAPGYALVDPVPAGAKVVRLAVPSQISKFAVGNYVTLYTNTAPVYPKDMYGELNLVTALNPATGQITLAYPANKLYSATLTYPYTLCAACAAPPFIGPLIPNGEAVSKNIVLQNFWYRGYSTFANYNVNDSWTEKNLTIYTAQKEDGGLSRHHYIYNETLFEDGFGSYNTMFAAVAAGSSDYVVTGSQYHNSHFNMAGQPCSEGSANISWTNNEFYLSGFADLGRTYNSEFIGAAMCYNWEFSNNRVHIKNTWMYSVLDTGQGSGGGHGAGKYVGNQFFIDSQGIKAGKSVVNLLSMQLLQSASEPVDSSNKWQIDSDGGAKRVNH